MIPEFDRHGNLPEGVHLADEAEFFGRFGEHSARRKWLAERLREIVALATQTGAVERILVWGSYVTSKESPNDLDLLLLVQDEFQLQQLPERAKLLFDHAQARMRFQADIFWARLTIGEDVLACWLDTYQTARDRSRRGIIELRLS